MARRFDITRLQAISQLPGTNGANWLVGAEDSVEFLKTNAESDEVVIDAIGPATLIHAVLAPLQQVTPPIRKTYFGASCKPTKAG